MTKLFRLVLASCFAITLHSSANSQSVSINTDGSTAHASALLDVKSLDKGVLIPRMSKAERNAIASPATGLMVFQNAPDSVGFYYYNGTSWLWLATANSSVGWLTTGNAGIDPTNNFLGTTDANSLRLRYNNIFSGQVNDTTTYLGYKAGLTNPGLAHNIGIGAGALQNNNTTHNIAIGDSALYGNTAGGVLGIGYRTLMSNAGFDNIAIGYNALDSNTSGYRNVAIGNHALRANKTGALNTAIGYVALLYATGSFNAGIGDYALGSNTTGGSNTAVGSNVLVWNNIGSANTAVGTNSMFNNLNGGGNTAVGYQSLFQNDSSSNNTSIGQWTLYSHKKNHYNTAVGFETMEFDSAGALNTAAGWRALRNNKTGVENAAFGVGTLESNSAGSYNVAVGRSAGFYTDTVDFTTSIGYGAATFNLRERTTAVGAYAGYSNSRTSTNILQGAENTMVGYAAMTGNAFGSQNVAVGYKAGAIFEPGSFSGTSPSRNVAIGDSAYQQGRGNDVVAIGYRALSKSTTNHSQHVAVGSRALLNAIATYPNTAVGYSSQDSLTTGFANTSVGSYSLAKNKIGYNNTAIGNAAMFEAYSPAGSNYPAENTAVGNDALRFTRYYGQTAMGSGALRNDTSGVYNTALGYLSMFTNLSGSVNTAVGTSSLRFNTISDGNTALGTNSMYNHKTGDFNTSVGYESMFSDTAGALNTVVGWRSLRYAQAGAQNTALGVGALEFTDSAYGNTAVGRGAMIGTLNNTSDLAYNTVMGWYAGAQMDSVSYATAIGFQAGYYNRGAENTFIGTNSGGGFTGRLTGIENTGVGAYTLTYDSTGMSNTAVGLGALYGNRTGNGSVAVGTRALANGGSYSYNIAIGDSAMYGNNASENMAIGTKSMWFNNTGTQNSAVGNYAMQGNSTGSYNTALGYEALLNSNAHGNTAVGFLAGSGNTTGTYNALFGYNANVASSALTNATAIGSNAYVAQSNTMILGSINGVNGGTSDTKVGIRTTTPDSTFSVADNFLVGSSGTVQYDNSVPVMNYMFKSGTSNADRMVIAHSPAASNWGLQYQDATDQFNFLGVGNSRLTIELGSGQVGIGTAAPGKLFHVFAGTSGAVTNGSSQILMEDNASSYFEMSTPDASENGILSSNTGGIRSGIIFNNAEAMLFRAGGNVNRMIITNTGNVGIGTVVPAFQLELSTNSAGKPTSTLWTVSSDERLKTIDGNYSKGLAEILRLNTILYHYKEGNARHLPTDEQGYGFSAQEVQKVFPEAVKTGKDGYLSLDLHPVFIAYINAFKEQQQQLNDLKKQNELLIKRIEKLENK